MVSKMKVILISGLILIYMVLVVSAADYQVRGLSLTMDVKQNETKKEEIKPSEDAIREDYRNFFIELNSHIAQTHGISLEEYQEVDIFNLEDSEDNFFLTKLYFDLPTDTGDKKPTVFLKNEKEGIILTQKANGKNVVYFIEVDPVDSWKIKSEKKVQGKPMSFEINRNKNN